jgi:putative DNA primase/helicase
MTAHDALREGWVSSVPVQATDYATRQAIIREFALFYAARGFYAFRLWGIVVTDGIPTGCACGFAIPDVSTLAPGTDPLRVHSYGKHPVARGWQTEATRDPAVLTRWWPATYTGGVPYNLGIACGPSRVVVLDRDTHDPAVDSLATFRALEQKLGMSLTDTWVNRTGGGGDHTIVDIGPFDDYPAFIGNLAKLLGPGLDIRQAGNLFVGPGSMHITGTAYEPIHSEDGVDPRECAQDDPRHWRPMPMPLALRDLLRKADTTHGPLHGHVRDTLLGRLAEHYGLVIRMLDDQHTAIHCPFSRDGKYPFPGGHSCLDSAATATVLYAATAGSRLGWLCCQHGKCRTRTALDALDRFRTLDGGPAAIAECDRILDDAKIEPLSTRDRWSVPGDERFETIVEDARAPETIDPEAIVEDARVSQATLDASPPPADADPLPASDAECGPEATVSDGDDGPPDAAPAGGAAAAADAPPPGTGTNGAGDAADPGDPADPGDAAERLLPSPALPMHVARRFVADRYTGRDNTTRARLLHHWRGGWWQYHRTCWREIDDDALRAALYRYTEHASYFAGKHTSPWAPTRKTIGNVREALAAVCHLPESVQPPRWTTRDAPTPRGTLVATRNGLLHVATRTLHPHDPRYFNSVAVPFRYEPEAAPPTRWADFLRDLWPDDADADSIATLQEFFGYVISGRIDLHKILLVIGPPRSGKGTIARILQALVGRGNCAGPTLASFSTTFGLQPLIGKPLAIISDARLGPRTDVALVVERLLSVSGEDMLTIDRKYKTGWTGTLPTRFFIISNELPRFNDSSGAIATRFLVLTLTRSWLGKEDTTLTEQLLAERSGILNWALDGLARLMVAGRFTEPTASRDATAALHDLVSPVAAFVRECCLRGHDYVAPRATLYTDWKTWAEDNGHKPGTAQSLGRNLRAVIPTLKLWRPREKGDDQKGDERPRYYRGITLQSHPTSVDREPGQEG